MTTSNRSKPTAVDEWHADIDTLKAEQRPWADVLPSSKWLIALADFVQQDDRRGSTDIARELRCHARRLSPAGMARGTPLMPSALWTARLAAWLSESSAAEAADLAQQVEDWSRELSVREPLGHERIVRL